MREKITAAVLAALAVFALSCEGSVTREQGAKLCEGEDQIEMYCEDCRVGGMEHTSWCSCKAK